MLSLGLRLCEPIEGEDTESARGGMTEGTLRGRRFGRVTVNKRTLRKPDRANTTSEKTVPAHDTWCPVKPIHLVMAMGRT